MQGQDGLYKEQAVACKSSIRGQPNALRTKTVWIGDGEGVRRKELHNFSSDTTYILLSTVTILGHGQGFGRNQEVGGPLVEIPHDFQNSLEISFFHSPLPSALFFCLTKCALFCVIRAFIDQLNCEASKQARGALLIAMLTNAVI